MRTYLECLSCLYIVRACVRGRLESSPAKSGNDENSIANDTKDSGMGGGALEEGVNEMEMGFEAKVWTMIEPVRRAKLRNMRNGDKIA
jgi:hypothetical protein